LRPPALMRLNGFGLVDVGDVCWGRRFWPPAHKAFGVLSVGRVKNFSSSVASIRDAPEGRVK